MARNVDWDQAKARSNRLDHGVSFDEAKTVLNDPRGVETLDEEHSETETRWHTVGRSAAGRLLVIVFTERGDSIRLISARRPNRRERQRYEER